MTHMTTEADLDQTPSPSPPATPTRARGKNMGNSVNHHRGPRLVEYQHDDQRRLISFSKHKLSIQNKFAAICQMTDAEGFLVLVAPSGKLHIIASARGMPIVKTREFLLALTSLAPPPVPRKPRASPAAMAAAAAITVAAPAPAPAPLEDGEWCNDDVGGQLAQSVCRITIDQTALLEGYSVPPSLPFCSTLQPLGTQFQGEDDEFAQAPAPTQDDVDAATTPDALGVLPPDFCDHFWG